MYACMHKKCLFQIRSIKKPVTFRKKIVFIAKCNEKNLFETPYSLEKKLSASPKKGNPPPLPSLGKK